MFVTRFNKTLIQSAFRYNFASAASVDYYKLLGIGRQATNQQIHNAYAEVTKKINPDNDPYLFNKISEAFVILNDNKARDAYDSLLRSYKVTYINEHQVKQPITKSYIAQRKAKKREQLSKKYNIDSFGRYRGGVPTQKNNIRGKSLGQTGQLYHPEDIDNEDSFPDYAQVNSANAESFKNFHQDERETRTIRRPWTTHQIDYNFFSAKRIFIYWPFWRFFLTFFVAIPALFEYYATIQKKKGAENLRKKRDQKKAAEEAKSAEVANQAV